MNPDGSRPSSNPFARNTEAADPNQGLAYNPGQESGSSSSFNPASTSASASSSIRPDEHDAAALILGLWGGMDVDRPQDTGSGSPFNLFDPQQTNPQSYSNDLLDQMTSGSASQTNDLALGGLLNDEEDSGSEGGLDPFEAFQAALGQAPDYQPMPSSTSAIGQPYYGSEGNQRGEGVEGQPKMDDADKGNGKASPTKPKARRVAKPKPPPKPKVPKKKPQAILISEIQIDGVWVPHVPFEGKLVPCDKRGDPLPISSSSLASSLPILPPSLSSAPPTASSSTSTPGTDPSSVRDARLGKRRRNDAAAPELDSNDEPESNQPSYAKKKVGVKSAKEKKSIADKERARVKKEKEQEVLSRLPKEESPYSIEHFGFGDEGKERALENEAYHELRDAVPALRALYNTHAPFNPLTDKPNPQTGLIDGILPIKEQNGKLTILSTSETYISHLKTERERIDWEKTALEEFVRKMDGGEAAWKKWRVTFDAQEEQLLADTNAQGSSSLQVINSPPKPQPIASSPTTKTFLLSRGAPRGDVELEPTPAVVDPSSSTSLLLPTTIKPEPFPSEVPSTSSSASPIKNVAMTSTSAAEDAEKLEALKERNRKKQRMFRQRQKEAIAKLEEEIKSVQGETK